MRPHHRAVIEFLRGIGAEHVRIESGGRHPRVCYRWHGIERYRVVSGSPEDAGDAARKTIEQIRRDLGLIDHEKRVGERRRRPARRTTPFTRPRLLLAPRIEIPVGPDWRDQLMLHPAMQATLATRLGLAWWALWNEIKAGHPGPKLGLGGW